jgi:hypothetical protein
MYNAAVMANYAAPNPRAQYSAQQNVSANLHIPPNKQRQANPTQMASPRPTLPVQPAVQRMLQGGIPVQPVMRPGQTVADMKPFMGAPKASNEDVRPVQVRHGSENVLSQLDRSNSLYSRTSWVPTAEYDAGLRAKLFGSQVPTRGRLGVRVIGDVVVEKMPEGLRALAEEVVGGIEEQGDERLPGQRKRKIQDLADNVDKGLIIDREVESVCHVEEIQLTAVDVGSRG